MTVSLTVHFNNKYQLRSVIVSTMEKVVIFGSTGMTGICAVEAAVKKGFVFTIYFTYVFSNVFFRFEREGFREGSL